MGSLPLRSEQESCNMFKVSFLLFIISLAASVTTGVTISCIQCRSEIPDTGGILGLCEGEEGTSVECPLGVCTKAEFSLGGGPISIVRHCGAPETGNSLTGNETAVELDPDFMICVCNSNDCNGGDPNGASTTQISIMVFIVVILLSSMNQ